MAHTIKSQTVTATKQADGSVNIVFSDMYGGVRYVANISNADFTTLNTSVNGGSTGATKTLSYGQVSGGSGNPYPAGYSEKD